MTQWIVVAVALLPLLGLAYGATAGDLGTNPIETITHVSGEWTLRLLFASLCITPLRRFTGINSLIRFRRTLGLLAFAYGCLHLTTWVVFDHFFDWADISADVLKRPYITVGFAGFVCLLALALTSTRGWIRRLGRNWQRLHRLAYIAAILGVIHYYWLVKADVRGPLAHAVVLAIILAARWIPPRRSVVVR